MVRLSLGLAAFLLTAPANARGLAIVGATLVDASGVLEDGIVVVSRGRVEAAGPRAHVPLAKGLALQNGRGLYLLPGPPWSAVAVEALRARPGARAAVLGALRERKARWRPGQEADLVVLDKDPLADPANLRAVVRVLRGGRELTPAEARESER